ncbi:MAG: hypothetical protein ABI400_02990 [Lacisediminihabitans sp.]
MSAEASASKSASPSASYSRRRAVWPVWAVAVFFAILYSYAFWEGIGNAVGVPQSVWASYHLGISAVGWVLLSIGVLLSPAVFVVCLLLSRGRGLIVRALVYAAGLCVVSAVMASLLIAPILVNFIA